MCQQVIPLQHKRCQKGDLYQMPQGHTQRLTWLAASRCAVELEARLGRCFVDRYVVFQARGVILGMHRLKVGKFGVAGQRPYVGEYLGVRLQSQTRNKLWRSLSAMPRRLDMAFGYWGVRGDFIDHSLQVTGRIQQVSVEHLQCSRHYPRGCVHSPIRRLEGPQALLCSGSQGALSPLCT